jgi:putative membrane protein
MMLDLVLAILHQLLVFALFGVLFAELILTRNGMDRPTIVRISSIDRSYGIMAGLILIVGFGRAHLAAKGWLYYQHNAYFWAKIVTFAIIGLLSVPPTICFIRWKRSGALPTDTQVAGVRRYMCAELALFALLPAFAAAMARGYGEF